MNINKKKLEMLEKFYELEKKRNQIIAEIQRLQAIGNQIVVEQDTLNKQFGFFNEMNKKEEKDAGK